MAASYSSLNYALRPAKHIERRMIFESLRRLDRLSNVTHYRYVGFASPFFVDFRLAHRELGLELMTNIEREVGDQERFEFNRPFGFIDLKWGESKEIIEELEWNERAILWLDFDKPLSTGQIATVQTAVGLLPSGSTLLVTTCAEPQRPMEKRIETMQDALDDYMPFDLTDPELLGGWSTAQLYRRIIDQAIRHELDIHNEGMRIQSQSNYRQLYNFHYRDGARMLTTGGILFDAGLSAQVDDMGMNDFDFVRLDSDPYEIAPPTLTIREMAHLESKFPCLPHATGLDFLKPSEIERHQALYRYAPRFADVDI